MERHRAAKIWKEKHRKAQRSTGGTDKLHTSHSGTEQDISAQSNKRYHEEAHTRMERHGQKRAAYILAEQEKASQISMGWCVREAAESRNETRWI